MTAPHEPFPAPGQRPDYAHHAEALIPVPQRLSIAAVLSLALALTCFIPMTGALAVVLGTTALFLIGRSQGRLGGRGLAIGGIVVGLIVTGLWIGMAIGVSSVLRSGAAVARTLFTALERDDLTAARAMFHRSADADLLDDDLRGFSVSTRTAVGDFVSAPVGLWDAMTTYLGAISRNPVTPADLEHLGGPTQFPVVVRFTRGVGVLYLALETPAGVDPFSGNLYNVLLVTESGTRVLLRSRPPNATPPAPRSADPAPAPAPDPAPSQIPSPPSPPAS
jgi:hypothetical protein